MTEYPRHWTCELTMLRLEAYLRRTLPLTESLAVAEHLEACDSCAHLLALMVERWLGPSGSELSAGKPRD
jgi:anti-sigma factor RsiW